jgi:hypothetical protein
MEFAFEVALCSHLERTTDWVLARQLGGSVVDPGARVVDVCGVVPGPEFDERAAVTDREIPPLAVESDVGPARAVDPATAFGCRPETAESVVEAALDRGFFERRVRDGRRLVRQALPYPESWFADLVAVENKPDLGRPGDLEAQLRFDVSLALFDRVYLATESYVTGAHLNRIPDAVGVWRFDPDDGERDVVREATPLPVGETGVEPGRERGLRREVSFVPAAAKRRARRRVAERAYGKGWRSFSLPACAHATTTGDGRPRCTHYGRVVDPATDCGGDCPALEAGEAPPDESRRHRDERTPWRRDPPGVARRQTGLDRFS